MPIALFLLTLPLLVLSCGLVMLSLADIAGQVDSFNFAVMLSWGIVGAILFLLWYAAHQTDRLKASGKSLSFMNRWYDIQEFIITISVISLWPMLVRNIVAVFDHSLISVLIALLVGFTLTISGLFIKANKAVIYSNIGGGMLVIFYGYFQIWQLGEGARVAASAFGLVAALVVGIARFKDYLKTN